jgi:hypothetical protein
MVNPNYKFEKSLLSDDHLVDGVFWYTKHVHYTLVWI